MTAAWQAWPLPPGAMITTSGENAHIDYRIAMKAPIARVYKPPGPLLSLFRLFEFMADPFPKCSGAGIRALLPQR
jgi:hypothetical protein